MLCYAMLKLGLGIGLGVGLGLGFRVGDRVTGVAHVTGWCESLGAPRSEKECNQQSLWLTLSINQSIN